MQQLGQKLKTGQMEVIEVPIPLMREGCVLVKNHYSLISAGTEGSSVKTARKGYIGKAKERPQQLRQVVDVLKSQGPVQTYRAVMKKLESYSPLGYSCAGEVIGVSPDITGFTVGDLVACGGLTACHSEVVNVPVNLCVKVRQNADLSQAAYNTLGAIALQGVRQADLKLGESCAVIGLGLLGQLTAILLRAAGIRVIGIDIDSDMIHIGTQHCLELGLNRQDHGIEDRILNFTGGIGCDGVIITAATDSLDPINFAGAISRKKGTIVVLGAVPTGFDREPHYYKKELQVKMSCSYGPGRYDPNYEEKGLDYPVGYVRWTENRNMQAFQELIYNKKIDLGYLTTHTFRLDEAPKAYDMILSRSEPFIGILIKYDTNKKIDRKPFLYSNLEDKSPTPSAVSIGFIGAGSYAQSHLLPNIPAKPDVSLKGVMTNSGTSARSVADRFKFEFCTTNEKDIIENQEINTVFIATRHDSHAYYVMKALRAGKHVFTEKPLCLNEEELGQVFDLIRSMAITPLDDKEIGESRRQPILMVGYNRRFSPFIRQIKEDFGDGPMAFVYRVNAGAIPKDSWYHDPEFGGGRIVGEVCHFVDTLTYLAGSTVSSVYATAMRDPNALNDTLNVSINFLNGSIGTISYFANGDKALPKERIEVFAHGATAIIDDFKKLEIYSKDKNKKKKLISQDKGQKEEIKILINHIIEGKGVAGLIPLEEIYNTSLVTFKIIESIRSGKCITILS